MARIKDGDWELQSYDPHLKRSVWRRYDGRKYHYKTTYEVSNIVEANKQEQNATMNQRWGEWRKVASIPVGLFFDNLGVAMQQRDENYIKKFLNDSDNRGFRTFLGTV